MCMEKAVTMKFLMVGIIESKYVNICFGEMVNKSSKSVHPANKERPSSVQGFQNNPTQFLLAFN